jgi:RNA polymerase sigma-70 factor (ECF subfamily)
MKILDECDSDEVCAEVNISASNLWTIMHRARLQVRECVENKWL